ncbi:MAG: hypothetical protein ACI39F_06025 [Acutalibacteraceae bacterium]
MSYMSLMWYCYFLSVSLSIILGALITLGIYKIVRKKGDPDVNIIAQVVEDTPVRSKNQEKLFNDLLAGKI